MRGVLHRASVVMRVVDDFTGEPVRDAVVYCLELRRSGIWNPSGYCLLSDLDVGSYHFTIARPGYCMAYTKADCLPEADCIVQTVRLYYSQEFVKLPIQKHMLLRFQKEGCPLPNLHVAIILRNPAGGLRVVQRTTVGAENIVLAGGQKASVLQRELESPTGERLLLTGFYGGGYTLQKPLQHPIEQGENLMPVWRMQTDWEGAAVLMWHRQFMQQEGLQLSVLFEKKKTQVCIPNFQGNEYRLDVMV